MLEESSCDGRVELSRVVMVEYSYDAGDELSCDILVLVHLSSVEL